MILNEPVKVGLRDKRTDKLIAVYPESLKGDRKEIDKKVFDWYYAQSCSAEDELKYLYVDIIN